jgi:hypothetical protein
MLESIERRKDEEANRFTRHEVKNGVLSAISQVCIVNLLGGRLRKGDGVGGAKSRMEPPPAPPAYSLAAPPLNSLHSDDQLPSLVMSCPIIKMHMPRPPTQPTAFLPLTPPPPYLFPQLDSLNEVSLANASTSLLHTLGSLRSGLAQTLETVLSQAMARDVVHGTYVPRTSTCLVAEVRAPQRGGSGGG